MAQRRRIIAQPEEFLRGLQQVQLSAEMRRRMRTLVDACRHDVDRFGRAFCPHLTSDVSCGMHRDFDARWRADNGKRGLKDVTAAPRGSAKTTHKVTIKTLHDVCYRLERFIPIFSSTTTLADDKVKFIKLELELNELIQMAFGPQQSNRWNMNDFVTLSGIRIMAASPLTQVRGIQHDGKRPTKIILDDAENALHVQTQAQREKHRKWFTEDISKLGEGETNIDVIGTIQHPESLMAWLLTNPGYRQMKYKAVINFASRVELWQQWREIFVDMGNDHRVDDSRNFFEAHARDMLADAEVLWPEHEPYYELMVMRLVEGDTAFWLEKQNEPLGDVRYLFKMDEAGYCEVEPGEIRRMDGRIVSFVDLVDVVGFCDPALGESGEKGDYAALVIVAQDSHDWKYVLDCYLKNDEPPSVQVEHMVDLLWRWKPSRLGLESNGFQSLFMDDLKQGMARRALEERSDWSPMYLSIEHTRAKPIRISTLEPQVTNRWLWFSSRLPFEAFRQMRDFRALKDAGHDDFPDALEGAVRLLENYVRTKTTL